MKTSKRLVKYLLFLSFAISINTTLLAQEESLGESIDRITFSWDTESLGLTDYQGLTKFCKDVDYRNTIIDLMNEIHHYDSVLYDKAILAQSRSTDKEIEKLIKEIESFEGKYSPKNFVHFLKIECDSQKELEKNAEDLSTAMGEESVDGQIYVIEVELQRYVKHLTHRVDNIRKHVHHLHIK